MLSHLICEHLAQYALDQRTADPDVFSTCHLGEVSTQLFGTDQLSLMGFDQHAQAPAHSHAMFAGDLAACAFIHQHQSI